MVRTPISFPAGTTRMNLAKFGFCTFPGENWDEVGDFLYYLDYAVALALVVGVV